MSTNRNLKYDRPGKGWHEIEPGASADLTDTLFSQGVFHLFTVRKHLSVVLRLLASRGEAEKQRSSRRNRSVKWTSASVSVVVVASSRLFPLYLTVAPKSVRLICMVQYPTFLLPWQYSCASSLFFFVAIFFGGFMKLTRIFSESKSWEIGVTLKKKKGFFWCLWWLGTVGDHYYVFGWCKLCCLVCCFFCCFFCCQLFLPVFLFKKKYWCKKYCVIWINKRSAV